MAYASATIVYGIDLAPDHDPRKNPYAPFQDLFQELSEDEASGISTMYGDGFDPFWIGPDLGSLAPHSHDLSKVRFTPTQEDVGAFDDARKRVLAMLADSDHPQASDLATHISGATPVVFVTWGSS